MSQIREERIPSSEEAVKAGNLDPGDLFSASDLGFGGVSYIGSMVLGRSEGMIMAATFWSDGVPVTSLMIPPDAMVVPLPYAEIVLRRFR